MNPTATARLPVANPDLQVRSLNSTTEKDSDHVVCRWISGAGAEEEREEIHDDFEEGRPRLEATRRARIRRGGRRRREARQVDLVPAGREAQEERGRDLFLHRLQV